MANKCCKLSGIVCKSGGFLFISIVRRVIVLFFVLCVIGVLFKKKSIFKVGFNYFYFLFRIKDFVIGIVEVRNNVFVFVQFLINRCGIQFDVRVRFFQRSDIFWRSYQYQNFDVVVVRFFQQVDGRDNGIIGCQYWVNDQRYTFIDVRNQFLEVRYRFQRFFITVYIDNVDARVRNVFQYIVYYIKIRTQNWYNGNFFIFDLVDFYRVVLVFDSYFFRFEVGGRFVSQQVIYFGSEFAKAFGVDILFTYQFQFVFDEWVFDFYDFYIFFFLRGSYKKNRRIIFFFFKAVIFFSLILVKMITV